MTVAVEIIDIANLLTNLVDFDVICYFKIKCNWFQCWYGYIACYYILCFLKDL